MRLLLLALFAVMFGAVSYLYGLVEDRDNRIEELKETVEYISDPSNLEIVVVVDENIKSKLERTRLKIEDLIEFYHYPRYINADDVENTARIINKYSIRYKVPENLIIAVINKESAFNPCAVSFVGAVGLMQVMIPTADVIAKELRIEQYDLFDTDTNIRFGTYYLRKLLKEFDTDHAVRAYNAGPGNVNRIKLNGGAYYPETIHYHINVMAVLETLNTKESEFYIGE